MTVNGVSAFALGGAVNLRLACVVPQPDAARSSAIIHDERGCDVINIVRFLDYDVIGSQIEQKEW